MFRLAGHLGMTVKELGERMDSRELAEWIAYTLYYEALPDSWRETGLLISALLAPYAKRGQVPKAEDFIPLAKAPQHESQDIDALLALKRQLEGL